MESLKFDLSDGGVRPLNQYLHGPAPSSTASTSPCSTPMARTTSPWA